MSESKHAISVSVLADGRYRTLCSCNFKGVRTKNRLAAEAQSEQHMNYVCEVARLTTAPTGEAAGEEVAGS